MQRSGAEGPASDLRRADAHSRDTNVEPALPAGDRTAWRRHALTLLAFALVFITLEVVSYTRESATWDEPVHVMDGYLSLARHDYRVDVEHPPLLRMWAALPLLGEPIAADTRAIDRTTGYTWASWMFSAFRSVFLRPLPYRAADRVLAIEKQGRRGNPGGVTLADFEFLRRNARSFEAVAWYGYFEVVALTGLPEPANLWVRSVSRDLFPLLGSKPLLGRTLAASDFEPNAPPAVVLSYDTWQKSFHGDPKIVGRQIPLSEQYPKPGETLNLVVGVMPKEFYFPERQIAAWLPMGLDPNRRFGFTNTGLGLLKPGVSVEHAERQTTAIMWDWARQNNGATAGIDPSQTRMKTIVDSLVVVVQFAPRAGPARLKSSVAIYDP